MQLQVKGCGTPAATGLPSHLSQRRSAHVSPFTWNASVIHFILLVQWFSNFVLWAPEFCYMDSKASHGWRVRALDLCLCLNQSSLHWYLLYSCVWVCVWRKKRISTAKKNNVSPTNWCSSLKLFENVYEDIYFYQYQAWNSILYPEKGKISPPSSLPPRFCWNGLGF